MNLQARINDRRKDDVTPIVERRIPEWRRRALELQAKRGNVAVTDLTGERAA